MNPRRPATPPAHDWAPLRADERPVERFSPHARHRLALGYANTYHVGMSSLGFQRTFEPWTYAIAPRASASAPSG